MRKVILFKRVFFLSIFFPLLTIAQKNTDEIPLAILPFVAARGATIENAGDVSSIQEAVTKEFSSKKRFVVLDRSKFESVVKELNIQKSEEFLNSAIVEQGKALGAKFLVTGIVNELKVVKGQKNIPKNILKPFGEKETVIYYQSSLRLGFSVINVETQQLIYNEPINLSSKDYFDGDPITSVNNIIKEMQTDVKSKIRGLFPDAMMILGIDKVDKKELPETVLINGGGSMFTGGDAKNLRLGVYITVAVGDLKREKKIGELKVLRVEGDVVVCQVKDGEKEIDENMKSKIPMAVKLIDK